MYTLGYDIGSSSIKAALLNLETGEPKQISGKQELYETIINDYI